MFYYPSSLAQCTETSRRLQFRHAVEEHKNSEMEKHSETCENAKWKDWTECITFR